MAQLPATGHEPIVLRTDFSDDAAWSQLCAAIAALYRSGSAR